MVGLNTKSTLLPLLNNSLCSYYWLGFLLADGHFSTSCLSIELSTKDKAHLATFLNFLSLPSSYLKIRTRCIFSGSFDQVSVKLNDVLTVPKIRTLLGLVETNKTKHPPTNISSFTLDQQLALFVGFIDGDGCISKRANYSSAILSIEVDPTWLSILQHFELLLKQFGNFTAKTRLYSSSTRTTICRFQLRKSTILRSLKQFATKNSLPILTRKWDNII